MNLSDLVAWFFPKMILVKLKDLGRNAVNTLKSARNKAKEKLRKRKENKTNKNNDTKGVNKA